MKNYSANMKTRLYITSHLLQSSGPLLLSLHKQTEPVRRKLFFEFMIFLLNPGLGHGLCVLLFWPGWVLVWLGLGGWWLLGWDLRLRNWTENWRMNDSWQAVCVCCRWIGFLIYATYITPCWATGFFVSIRFGYTYAYMVWLCSLVYANLHATLDINRLRVSSWRVVA